MTTTHNALYHATRNFMARDHQKDVDELNELIRKKKSINAGLIRQMPPIPFTGNPWSKSKGNCVLLVGINPRWHERGTKQYEKELLPSMKHISSFHSGDNSAFDKYLDSRNDYFKSGMKYGRHFTFLENRFRENCYPVENPWERHIQSIDCIPWFSDDTDDIDVEMVALEYLEHPAFCSYIEVIKCIIDLIEPNWIHINGKFTRLVFEKSFSGYFERMKGMDRKDGVFVGHCIIGDQQLPLLAHNFAGSRNSPNIEGWKEMMINWEALVAFLQERRDVS